MTRRPPAPVPAPIAAVVVAVPARDEERRLPAALAAVAVAAQRVGVPVRVTVAADACADGTELVALRAGASVVPIGAGRVGAARRAAVAAGLASAGAAPEAVWIVTTDADSRVPPDWLAVHLAAAAAGAVLLRGTVEPDPAELSDAALRRWADLEPVEDVHDRVHGANLGVRGDAYLAARGFPDAAADEDVALVAALRRLGVAEASTARAAVVTSARLTGRAPRGFAAYLREQVVDGWGVPPVASVAGPSGR